MCASIRAASTCRVRPSTVTAKAPPVRVTTTCRRRPPTSTSYCICGTPPYAAAQPFERALRARHVCAPAAPDRSPPNRSPPRLAGRRRQHRLQRGAQSRRSPRPPASPRRTACRCAPSALRRGRWCGTARRANSGCASSHVKNGSVVLMPVTRYSPSARRMRAIGERAILRPRDQLRDHRVVEDRHVEAGGRPAVVADARVPPATRSCRMRPGDGRKLLSGSSA